MKYIKSLAAKQLIIIPAILIWCNSFQAQELSNNLFVGPNLGYTIFSEPHFEYLKPTDNVHFGLGLEYQIINAFEVKQGFVGGFEFNYIETSSQYDYSDSEKEKADFFDYDLIPLENKAKINTRLFHLEGNIGYKLGFFGIFLTYGGGYDWYSYDRGELSQTKNEYLNKVYFPPYDLQEFSDGLNLKNAFTHGGKLGFSFYVKELNTKVDLSVQRIFDDKNNNGCGEETSQYQVGNTIYIRDNNCVRGDPHDAFITISIRYKIL